jgi:tetratricopeptide (TPR) repeat protein
MNQKVFPAGREASRIPFRRSGRFELSVFTGFEELEGGPAVEYTLKSISKAGIAEATAKVELYRYLNEPEEAESICRDILAIDPQHQLALRLLGLSITDQFLGVSTDRYNEAASIFQKLADPYEQFYYAGILYERRAKAQLNSGQPPHSLLPLFERALECFGEAEKIRPKGNDDSILRWNRCVRLLQSPLYAWNEEGRLFEPHDAPPSRHN